MQEQRVKEDCLKMPVSSLAALSYRQGAVSLVHAASDFTSLGRHERAQDCMRLGYVKRRGLMLQPAYSV